MKEFLTDMSLRQQTAAQDELSPFPAPLCVRLRLREVHIITSWTCCFATYLAVLATAGKLTPRHIAYMRLLITEAIKYPGDGWCSYDSIFRQTLPLARWDCPGPKSTQAFMLPHLP